MKKLSTNQIRQIWIEFFKSKNHLYVEPKSLIPVNDPSLLWINSGVATLKDYFSGKKNPPSQRLVNIQKAIRTNDILNVGVTARHHTFFEMMGNFSIGDYFKDEAIEFAYELLIKKLEIPQDKLYITVFKEDKVAYDKWISLGISPKKIIKGDRDRNFWDVGQGPCGPCTEIYFDRGEKYDPNKIGEKLIFEDIENDRYVEIWNIVFSQFNNDGKNNYSELARKNIDTGAGLERFACIFQDVPTNYDTDAFQHIIKAIEKMSSKKYDMNAYFTNDLVQKQINHDYIVITDHIKSNVFAIADGAVPSNKERGSVLRKLIRRAMVCARRLEINQAFISTVVDAIIDVCSDFFPYLKDNKERIVKVLTSEEALFNKTLDNGFNLFNKAFKENRLNADVAFKLTETYGFPYEIIEELMSSNNITINKEEYLNKVKQHQEISKSKKDVKGMAMQNASLINFKTPSTFDYDAKEMTAKVIGLFDDDFNPTSSLSEDGWVAFDNTCFYATSGGQMHDIGTITFKNHTVEVNDVIKGPNKQHFHHIKNSSLININESANLQIDVLNREQTTRNHSTEHLLHKALREIVDQHIKQEGAFKSASKLTFDFACDHHLSSDKLIEIENKVNEYIKQGANVKVWLKTFDEAKEMGAIGHFEDVYKRLGGKLRVVDMENITCDICGGTHVHNTANIEQFMITKFYSIGGGLYRIEAITSNKTINETLETLINTIKQKIEMMNQSLADKNIVNKEYDSLLSKVSYRIDLNNYHLLNDTFTKLVDIYNGLINKYNKENGQKITQKIKDHFNNLDQDSKYLIAEFNKVDNKIVSSAMTELINEHKDKCYISIIVNETRTQYILMANKQFCSNNHFTCNDLIKKINLAVNGQGGGRDTFAQGGCSSSEVIGAIKDLIKK